MAAEAGSLEILHHLEEGGCRVVRTPRRLWKGLGGEEWKLPTNGQHNLPASERAACAAHPLAPTKTAGMQPPSAARLPLHERA